MNVQNGCFGLCKMLCTRNRRRFTYKVNIQKLRGHPGSNQGPLDLQSNALPLSYIPFDMNCTRAFSITRKKTTPKHNINKCFRQIIGKSVFTYLSSYA